LRPWFAGRIPCQSPKRFRKRWGILEVLEVLGTRTGQLKGIGFNAPDGLIAATALEHDLNVVFVKIRGPSGGPERRRAQPVTRFFTALAGQKKARAPVQQSRADARNENQPTHTKKHQSCYIILDNATRGGLRLEMNKDIRHKGLKRLFEQDDPSGVNSRTCRENCGIFWRPSCRSNRCPPGFAGASVASLKGRMKGFWAVTVRPTGG